MRRRSAGVVGAMLLASIAGGVSCATNNDDPVGRACSVIVRDCHAMQDMGDCIDAIGDLGADCILCIGDDADCSYFSTCQRAFATCTMPPSLKPPGSGDS